MATQSQNHEILARKVYFFKLVFIQPTENVYFLKKKILLHLLLYCTPYLHFMWGEKKITLMM